MQGIVGRGGDLGAEDARLAQFGAEQVGGDIQRLGGEVGGDGGVLAGGPSRQDRIVVPAAAISR